jgi:hypothetical protein
MRVQVTTEARNIREPGGLSVWIIGKEGEGKIAFVSEVEFVPEVPALRHEYDATWTDEKIVEDLARRFHAHRAAALKQP